MRGVNRAFANHERVTRTVRDGADIHFQRHSEHTIVLGTDVVSTNHVRSGSSHGHNDSVTTVWPVVVVRANRTVHVTANALVVRVDVFRVTDTSSLAIRGIAERVRRTAVGCELRTVPLLSSGRCQSGRLVLTCVAWGTLTSAPCAGIVAIVRKVNLVVLIGLVNIRQDIDLPTPQRVAVTQRKHIVRVMIVVAGQPQLQGNRI